MSDKKEHENTMQYDLNSLVNEFKNKLDGLIDKWSLTTPKIKGKPIEYPLTDVIDDGDYYIIEAELPGVERKDIIVEIAADLIRIKGSINLDREATYSEANYLLRERKDQDFNKEIVLPHSVNQKEAEATLEEGVLKIKIPKKPPESLEFTKIIINENQS